MSRWLNEWFKNKGVVEATIDVANSMAENSVTDAMLVDMPANSVKVNSSAIPGDPSNLPLTASQLVGTNSAGELQAITVNSSLNINAVGLLSRAAITGDVVIAGGTNVSTVQPLAIATGMIQDNAVGNIKAAKMPSLTLKGNTTGILANSQDIVIGGGLSMDSANNKVISKGNFSFRYKYSTTITEADPGSGFIRTDNSTAIDSITELYLNPIDSVGRNIFAYINLWQVNGKLKIMSNDEASTAYGIFTITLITNNATNTWYSIGVTPLGGVGSLPANNESIIIEYLDPSNGITFQDVLDGDVVRVNGSGQLIDKNAVVISGTLTINTYTDLPSAAANIDLCLIAKDLGNNSSYKQRIPLVSNGTFWEVIGGESLFAEDCPLLTYIAPATTFTSATASSINAGTDIRLTSAGAHGLTSAVAVGKKLYVSAGTNWTVGFYTIKTIAIDTTGLVIDLEEPFVTGMGVPTIALAGTDVPFVTLNLPPLNTNSRIRFDITTEFGVASTNSKHNRIFLGATEILDINSNGATTAINRVTGGFSNQNNTASQRTWFTSGGSSGVGTGTTGTISAAEDTSSVKTLAIKLNAANANDPMTLSRWSFWIKL